MLVINKILNNWHKINDNEGVSDKFSKMSKTHNVFSCPKVMSLTRAPGATALTVGEDTAEEEFCVFY